MFGVFIGSMGYITSALIGTLVSLQMEETDWERLFLDLLHNQNVNVGFLLLNFVYILFPTVSSYLFTFSFIWDKDLAI